MAKSDEILGYLIEIKTHTGATEEHLRTLNGKVLRNMEAIEVNRKEIEKQKLQWSKMLGAAMVVFFIIQVGLALLL